MKNASPGSSRGALGPILGGSWPLLVVLKALLVVLKALLAALGSLLGALVALLWRSWGALGCSWVLLKHLHEKARETTFRTSFFQHIPMHTQHRRQKEKRAQ